jgi:hypothetical protein
MADFSGGVSGYIWGKCIVKVHFPIDYKDNAEINCYQCKFFSRNNGICQLTKEVSEYPTKYIGSKCPLDFSGEINETKE